MDRTYTDPEMAQRHHHEAQAASAPRMLRRDSDREGTTSNAQEDKAAPLALAIQILDNHLFFQEKTIEALLHRLDGLLEPAGPCSTADAHNPCTFSEAYMVRGFAVQGDCVRRHNDMLLDILNRLAV